MADIHEILTRLVNKVREQAEADIGIEVSTLVWEFKIHSHNIPEVIDNAAKQIEQQQQQTQERLGKTMAQLQNERERVEKLREAEGMMRIIFNDFSFESDLGTCLVCAPSPYHSKEKCPVKKLEAALKELEAK